MLYYYNMIGQNLDIIYSLGCFCEFLKEKGSLLRIRNEELEARFGVTNKGE